MGILYLGGLSCCIEFFHTACSMLTLGDLSDCLSYVFLWACLLCLVHSWSFKHWVSCVTAACWRSAYNATKCSFHNITLQRHPVVSFQQKQWLSQCKPCTGWLHYLGESFLNLFIVRILICWCFSLFFNTIWMWKY